MGKASNKTWACPFYKWSDYKLDALKCECAKLTFPDRQSMDGFTGAYCAGEVPNWEKCTYAKMMNEYYERKYRDGKKHS